jgi:hypothetical protein
MARSEGAYSSAEGNGNTSSGAPSHAEGSGNLASGLNSHAEGGLSSVSGNTASGVASHVEGGGDVLPGPFPCVASGHSAHAEGLINTSSGKASHTEGTSNTASGNFAHAEGSGGTASGVTAHTEGSGCIASGDRSHAGGNESEATRAAQYSHASGSLLAKKVQRAEFEVFNTTGGIIPVLLLLTGPAGASINIQDGRAYTATMKLVALANNGTSKGWTGSLAFKRIAGVTANVGAVAPLTVAGQDAGAAAWSASWSANVATNELEVTVTGVAGTNIFWMCAVDWVETEIPDAP